MKLFNKVAAIAVGVMLATGVGAGIVLGSRNAVKADAAAGDSASGSWTKITSASDINTTDDFLIGWEYNSTPYYSMGTVTSSGINCTSTIGSAKVVRFETATGGYYIKQTSSNYINNSSSTNIALGAKSSIWTIDSNLYIRNTSNSNRFLGAASNSSSARLKAYASGNENTYPQAFVYKAAGSALTKLSTPVVSYSNGEITWGNVEHSSSYDLTIDGGSVVHNATSPYDVSDLPLGSHSVTVVAVGDGVNYSNSEAGSVSFSIVIHSGTQADPYTAAEAKAVALSGDTSSHYVAGFIASMGNNYLWMTDSIESTHGDFELYGGYTNNSQVELALHYYILAHGTFSKYNTTAEATSSVVDSVEYVVLSDNSITVSEGNSVNITATSNGALAWSLTNGTGSASLSNQSNSGATITGVSEGDASLRVTRGHYYIDCTISVTEFAYATSTLTVGTNTSTVTWPTANQVVSSVINDGFTFEMSGTGSNSGSFNYSNTDWRLYQTESTVLTISSSTRSIVKVNIVYNISNTGILTYGGNQYESATTINVGGLMSASFSIGNTTSATNGQVRIKSITISYEEFTINYIEITGSMTKTQYELGVDTGWNPKGLIVTAYYVNNAREPQDVTNSVNWTYSAAFPTVVSNIELTITATLIADNTKTDTKVVNVSVIEKIPAVVDGEQYILAYPASNYYFTGINDSGSTDFGIATHYAAFAKTDYVLTAVENGDGTFSFETTNSTYLAWTSGNSLKEIDSIDESAKWDVSKNSDGSASIQNSTDDTRYLQFNATSGQQRFATYTGGQHNPTFIHVDNHALAGNFVECYMHPEIVHNPLDSDSGACKDSGEGYYTAAQTAYAQLSADVKSEFAGNSDFANYVARLTAWASANGYTFDAAAGTFTKNNSRALLLSNGESATAAAMVVVVVSTVSITAVGGFFLLKKKPF